MRWRWRAPESSSSSERLRSEASDSRRIVASRVAATFSCSAARAATSVSIVVTLLARQREGLPGLLDLEGVTGDLLVQAVPAVVALLLLDLRLVVAVAERC